MKLYESKAHLCGFDEDNFSNYCATNAEWQFEELTYIAFGVLCD